MKNKIHLLIPMSGQGNRYREAGYTEPKPLIPVNGVPMIERLLANFPLHWPTHFVMADNHKETKLPEVLRSHRPNSQILYIQPHKLGPSYAVLEGLKNIPDQDAVMVSYCDYALVWDAAQFERFVRDSSCDACLVSYRGFHAHYLHPLMYAYSRMDGQNVVEVKEKGSFTDNRENEFASCGAYYFKSAKLLRQAIEYQQKIDLQLKGEFYTSLTVEALIRMKREQNQTAHVRVFENPGFFQWGTPDDLQNYEYFEKTFQAFNREVGHTKTVAQVLIPMAVLGSRFGSITPLPKPLIPVDQKAMFVQALESLPLAKQDTVLVALDSFSKELQKAAAASTQIQKLKIVSLPKTPEGQALSTAAGLGALDPTQPVIISSCDHGIVLAHTDWSGFQKTDADAAIFTIKGFPGANRRPEAFAYVVPDPSDSSRFPKIKNVSVKKPVSTQPKNDSLLVGTFWFKNPVIAQQAIDELVKKNIRVNNELYLDSVFNLLIEKGLSVRMIPLEGYINWGDPDSLAESLYWQELLCGYKIEPRPRFAGITAKGAERA